MTKSKKIIILSLVALIIIAVIITIVCVLVGQNSDNIRDMSEVERKGSFVMNVESQKALLPATDKTYIFKSYDDFVDNDISNLTTYTTYKTIDGENIRFDYKAKNERYNEDFFKDSDLMIVFFNTSVNVSDFLVSDVIIDGNNYTIDVVGQFSTGYWQLKDETDVLYACFLEISDIPTTAVASVNVKNIYNNSSIISHYYDDKGKPVTLPDDKIIAYYIPDLQQLESFVSQNSYIGDDMLSLELKMKYNREFFNENGLMIVVVPGIYRGYISIDCNNLSGVGLDLKHYKTFSENDEADLYSLCTNVISFPVEKNFAFEELTYRFYGYKEWNETAGAVRNFSDAITLVKQSDNGYIVFSQQ